MSEKESEKVYRAAVLTISDACARQEREDGSGKAILEILKGYPYKVERYEIIPDESSMIKERLAELCDSGKIDLVLTTGGTGFAARDVTPEATRAIIEREAPGIPEAMRTLCLGVTKRAMLSRGIAGLRKKTLIVNLPGSPRGAEQSLRAIIETLLHGLAMIAGKRH